MEKVNYRGWPNCYRLSNDQVELIVTTDVGPRIIRFGFKGGPNEFKEFDAMMGLAGGDVWRIYGGHRFWHAPEIAARTYYPDNEPVAIEQHDGFVRVVQPTESTTGMQKELDIRLWPVVPRVRVTHRLRNNGVWAVELAPWALSVMAPGGKVVIPLPPRGSHPQDLLPTNTITLWAYTYMADPRWTWGSKYIMLRQDPAMPKPQKLGVSVPDGWVAYARGGHLFVKKYTYVPGASYLDFGSSVETYTDAEFLEVETLGPTVRLEPSATVEHVEDWFLYSDVPMPQDDADVDRDILPRVRLSA
jgi:hypothetical protein